MHASSRNPHSEKQLWPDYLTIWRWHFYAGLLCIPIVVILSITGTIYLFKPQIQAWADARIESKAQIQPPLTISTQINRALDAMPDSLFVGLELTEAHNHRFAAISVLHLRQGHRDLRVHVESGSGKILQVQEEDRTAAALAKKIHGELLLGKRGSYLVELTACWTLVMVLTGLALWWPRTGWKLKGVLYPRLGLHGRVFWKDLHSVAGFWTSGLILVLIITGLPWATFWGDYFKSIRYWTNTAAATQDWEGGHGDHQPAHRQDSTGPKQNSSSFRRAAPPPKGSYDLKLIDQVAPWAQNQNLQPPVMVKPPQNGSTIWSIQSLTANRPLRATLHVEAATLTLKKHEKFEDKHWLDRLVGHGIALHEGARFGGINQLLALVATAALLLLCTSAIVMWWRRRNSGLGAPHRKNEADKPLTMSLGRRILVTATIAGLSIAMPLFGLSVVILVVIDQLVIRHSRSLRVWLGYEG